jgi:hypothetical protein
MNKITTQIKPEFTPGWSAALEALVNINAPVQIALGASEAIAPTPATSPGNISLEQGREAENGIIYSYIEQPYNIRQYNGYNYFKNARRFQ